MRKTHPHLLGIAGFLLAGMINGTLHLLIVDKLLHLGSGGLGPAASWVAFPVYAAVIGTAWILLWLVHERVVGQMPLHRTIVLGLALGLGAALIVAGQDGFSLHGASPLINYFLIDLTAGAAIIHYLLVQRASRDTP